VTGLEEEGTSTGNRPDSGDTRARRLQFIGAAVTFVVLVTGVIVVFCESYTEWGGLPPVGGPGLILYGGVAAALVIGIVWLAYAWIQWRNSGPA
jgi:hypothetical protein